MSNDAKLPEARPFFRKLALVVSYVCLILGFVLWFAVSGAENRYPETLCFVVAYIMAVISGTGRLPQLPKLPEQPDARPMFRKLALGVSMVCLALALLFTFGDFGQGMFPAIICYFVGYVMLVIWQTGKWPPRK